LIKGYDSSWTNIGAGGTVTFTHNLGVDPSRMLIDVMANNGALGAGACHYIGFGGDLDGGNVVGYVLLDISPTILRVVRGANDTDVLSVRVRIRVEG